jgi:hypothetical protein
VTDDASLASDCELDASLPVDVVAASPEVLPVEVPVAVVVLALPSVGDDEVVPVDAEPSGAGSWTHPTKKTARLTLM